MYCNLMSPYFDKIIKIILKVVHTVAAAGVVVSSVDKGSLFPTGAFLYGVCMFFSWVLSRYSSFFALPKITHTRLIDCL